MKAVREWLLTLAGVYLLVTFGLTIARVSGESMSPTLQDNQPLLLLKYTRWLEAANMMKYRRGDLIIFKIPKESPYAYAKANFLFWEISYRPYNIKRIVAIEGETVSIKDGILYINGKELKEDYASDGYMNDFDQYTVPKDHYFVLGDNRILGESLDSRAYESISRKDIAGSANISLWPLGILNQKY